MTLTISLGGQTAFILGLYNNYWEDLFCVGVFFYTVTSILGTAWILIGALLVERTWMALFLTVYVTLALMAYVTLLHVIETELAWIVPLCTILHAVRLSCVSILRITLTMTQTRLPTSTKLGNNGLQPKTSISRFDFC